MSDNPHTRCPFCGDPRFSQLTGVGAYVAYRCESQGHQFDSNTPVYDSHEDDRPNVTAATGRKAYDGHTIVIDGPVWTDADRDELVRALKIIMAKEIDLRIGDHRLSVLAVGLLRGGWKRTVRP